MSRLNKMDVLGLLQEHGAVASGHFRLASGLHTPVYLQPALVLQYPHVAQKVMGSAIDGRTTRHTGYAISQRKRKLIEQVFGWLKTIGLLRKLRHRGGLLVDWIVTFAATAYNLVRLRTLLALAH